MSRKLITEDEAVECSTQHKTPCSDCPWRRDALNGWLGGGTVESWIATAHSDEITQCHTLKGPQCAGIAIYRANVCKLPRDRDALVLPPDRNKVFASPVQFEEHHRGALKIKKVKPVKRNVKNG